MSDLKLASSHVTLRYGQDFEDTIDVEGLREVQKSMNAPLLELVGFDKVSKKQREFHKLRVISVRGHLVDRYSLSPSHTAHAQNRNQDY